MERESHPTAWLKGDHGGIHSGIGLTEEEIEYLFSQEVLPWFEVIKVQPSRPFVIDDPSDDKFIWCALEGQAEAIISSDQHLLRLNSCPVPIFSLSEFLRVERRKYQQ
jgi:predicted nucleic acid-binding protein